jgi:2-aminoethylphosphonate-pyruvate transaminase
MATKRIPGSRDKPLFTPGPLTTSLSVKQAMLRDLGSRDAEFIAIVWRVRERLLALAGVSRSQGYEAVLMQGSGTFGVEAVISSATPPGGKLLVIANGAYGERMAKIASAHRIAHDVLRFPEHRPAAPAELERRLGADASITNVALVHCETTTGIFNPAEELAAIVRRQRRSLLLDSMSAFGAVPMDLGACPIDYVVSSANKCIEGVPGFSFAICRREALLASEGWARTLSLDLLAQWKGLEADGQFRFTPPTHALLAFDQALSELEDEGGPAARGARYRRNHEALMAGMRALGFREYLPPELQGPIISSFLYPEDPRFVFEDFYRRLGERGFVIYPGRVSSADCFRVGTIGRIFPADVEALIAAIGATLDEMGVRLKAAP